MLDPPPVYDSKQLAYINRLLQHQEDKEQGEKIILIGLAVDSWERVPKGKREILYFCDILNRNHVFIRDEEGEARHLILHLTQSEIRELVIPLRLFLDDKKRATGEVLVKKILHIDPSESLNFFTIQDLLDPLSLRNMFSHTPPKE